ncbi:MAG: PEPxxWA-CTERM sorting domain-containing protein [Alphaproteobacteria bacterium]|nr:PEPxxWA-CTERM sorting domain-containing protein [Alphaproteobacteria bacterium]MBU1516258.1 PEPxxWA-CTERM sorting domain-containing protein [Alphaproteobacteria bacterium]MBU2095795.1 PEPxxWA-CTERM sorting domain-containing protein [Alphaproteobacteria bacterium]MBU2151911.1 PEPxxWA-CTERM sorting domain-containing protein [Alphaproteobacteria bacterium]MBU2306806.1 PEPxxWA-CTERM sorting domain-containing protein [Alphaproteobacteria bacterium]
MRNTLRALCATAAAAVALTAASSASALTVTIYNDDLPLPAGQTMIEDFDAVNASGQFSFVGDANTFVRDGSLGLWDSVSAPPPGDTTNYFTITGGGKATLTSAEGMGSFSFFLGSPDNYNFVKFTDFSGNSVTLQGSQIWNATTGDNGDQSWGRRVSYNFDGSVIKTVEFSSTGNSFEFDSLASAPVPEPASWALMIMGFGTAGAMIRRRRTASTFA